MLKGVVKVYTALVGEYYTKTENKSITENKYFNTTTASIFPTTDLCKWFSNHVVDRLLSDVEEFQEYGSGWSIKSIQFLKVHISK